MKFFVSITDKDWYSFLAKRNPPEVNFWQPSSRARFRAIHPGAPFLFKLHSPDDYIVGSGFFINYDALPLSLAWDVFGEHNGAPDIISFRQSVMKYRQDHEKDPVIGCIVLSDPFFFRSDDWIPIPSDWESNIVQGKTYDTSTSIGASLWKRVSDLILSRDSTLGDDLLKGASVLKEKEFGSLYLARARLGQGAFRVLVTASYDRCCAISGERVLPVLEAAHIKPHSESGPNHVTNGILLRSDFHKLFDRGYITVTPSLEVKVSKAIRDHYHNGRYYLVFDGKKLAKIPRRKIDRPAREYLEWHNDERFIA